MTTGLPGFEAWFAKAPTRAMSPDELLFYWLKKPVDHADWQWVLHEASVRWWQDLSCRGLYQSTLISSAKEFRRSG